MVRAVITLWISILRSCAALFRSRQDQAIVELALRQQLAVYARRHPRPRLSPVDRAFWVALSRLWPQWKSVLGHRSARDRGQMAPAPFPSLLALDLNPGPRETSDLGRDQGADSAHGHREPLARPEDPGRAVEARNPGESRHDLAVPAQGRSGSWLPAALDDIPPEPPRSHLGDGLLRRAHRPLPAPLRLVRNRPRAKASPPLQRDREPDGVLGGPAATGRVP